MDVVTIRQSPALRRPILVAAFKGWNDAGEAATAALASLRRSLRARTFATIEPDEFFDFQVNRPVVRDAGGGGRRLVWPRNRFSWAQLPDRDQHVVLLEGTEPNLRWGYFATAISDLAGDLGIETVITLGALQVDAPHTRPVQITGSASRPELSDRLPLRPSTYEGPTGITGVLTLTSAEAGFDTVSLWAGVPHYLAGTRYLSAALSLARDVGRLIDSALPLDRLVDDAREQEEEITSLVAEDSDLAEYVAELESRADEEEVDDAPLATGEQLAAEFERYLRERGSEGSP